MIAAEKDILMPKINTRKISPALLPYVPYAEKWGHQSPDTRAEMVDNASIEELHELASLWDACIGVISDWLAEPEVSAKAPFTEYIAFTCLILVVDRARYRLENDPPETLE
jgi:hypothetical protein